MSQEQIIQKLEEKLGTEEFISPKSLVAAGIYGSSSAVRNALRNGSIPHLKISSHRVLISKADVIEHLRTCASASQN